jgi:serine/threonine protein phosphatase PrpC
MNFSIWIEKIENKGEDAPPTLLFGDDNTGILAVYDGLGGAGSKTYPIENQDGITHEYSGAYLASRLAKAILEDYYMHTESDENFVENLAIYLQEEFNLYLQKINTSPSKLKSKLIKQLPTTLAGIFFEENETELYLDVFWAGDSRCYVMTQNSLMQLSKDDLNGHPDALQNLREDALISNCLYAGDAFVLHHFLYRFNEPCLLITATDGCFGYVETPAHFEYILLNTLMNSYYDLEDWQEKLTDIFSQIAADDVSMSLLAWGFDNLNELKNYFYPRYLFLFHEYILPLQNLENQTTQDNVHITKNQLQESLWNKYKGEYDALS